MKKLKTAIIIPAYNEEQTIEATVRDFHKYAPLAEIWIINNNSSDQTQFISERMFVELAFKGGVIYEPLQGKGNALRRAFSEIDADIYIVSDADLTYPANELFKLIDPVLKGQADMVVGDRLRNKSYILNNKRRFHNFGNNLVGFLVNKLFGSNLSDIMSGFRVLNKKFVKNYPILVDGFEIETDMTLHALDKKFRIREVEINYKDRPSGSHSKLNTFSDGFRVLKKIFIILRHYKPFFFFGILSLFFLILGLLLGMPVIFEWLATGYINHMPLAILSSSLEIISLIFFITGIILDSLAFNERRRFEINILQYK